MRISISEDKGQLTELVLRAEAGDEVVLTRSEEKGQLTELVLRAEAGDEVVLTHHGKVTVRLVPVQPRPSAAVRRAVIADIQAAARHKRTTGAGAARSQDFLYDSVPSRT